MTASSVRQFSEMRQAEQQLAPYPRQLVLDWTDYCNAKCFFCSREAYEQEIGGKGTFIPFAQLRKLERVLSNIKIFAVSSAIGEPLLHPELEQILRWLYSINPSILLQTVTNGTALTADKADWFAGHLDWLSVSLNAANAEAHMRDMFPHLAKRGIDPHKRWDVHIRHLTEFLSALPPDDRSRIRFQMVAHRYNVKDVTDFVRLVHKMGGSQAVITNISVHPATVDWSLYWIKDEYNDAVDQACEIGARLGVQVHAARFYTGVKPVLDLDKVCRDPVEIAYISRSSSAAPCCQWAESKIQVDYYSDEAGFERYWNSDLLQQLRRKRDSTSCRVCGLSRIFDETSFHLSPSLKQQLIAAGRLSAISTETDYPDAALVRTCIENGLDLPSIRRTLQALQLPVEMAAAIEGKGLAALPELEHSCWQAYQNADVQSFSHKIPLAGRFIGIGWGAPVYEHQKRISARSLGAALAASIFVRVRPGTACEVRFTIHQASPVDLPSLLGITVCGRTVETRLSRDESGRTVVNGIVSQDLTQAFDGRLWVRIGCFKEPRRSDGVLSLILFQAAELAAADAGKVDQVDRASEVDKLDDLVPEKDLLLAQQRARLIELEEQLAAVYASRSWRLTAPLRRLRRWLHK